MEIGDVINFLLIVAFAVIAPIIGAITKSKNKKSTVTTSKEPKSTFEDIILGFQNDVKNVKSQSSMEYASSELQGQKYPEENLMTENVYVHEVENAYKEEYTQVADSQAEIIKSELRESFKQNVKSEESSWSVANDFNIKKAVIFSEILNTKYF